MLVLDLIAAHLVGDFVLQSPHMAKRKLVDWRVRLLHVAIYSLPFAVVLLANDVSWGRGALFLVLNFLVHFLIDSRRWASGAEWAPRPILVDQSLHAATLALLAHLL